MLLASLVLGACSSKVALRYHPRGTPVHHYVLTMRSDREDAPVLSAAPRQSRVWTIYYTQFDRFTDPAGTGSEVGLRVDSAQLQVGEDASPPELSIMKGRNITAFFDGHGQLLRTEPADFPGLTPDMVLRLKAMAEAAAPSFPSGAVAAGDAWPVSAHVPLDAFETNEDDFPEVELRATLHALREPANDRLAEIGVDGQLAPRETQVTTSLGQLAARSGGSVVGRYTFSLLKGLMISGDFSGSLTLVTDAPLVGRDTLLSRVVTQTSVRLQ